jgi:hypothetical protein
VNTNQISPITLVAGAALAANRRVKLSSGQAVYSGAGEDFIGVTEQAAASGSPVSIRLIGDGTLKAECAGAVTAYAAVYGAADGKIDDTASGKCIGFAQETGADGRVIEVVPTYAGPQAALTSAALTDNSGGTPGATIATISSSSTYTAATAGILKNAIASLAAQINALRVDMIGA